MTRDLRQSVADAPAAAPAPGGAPADVAPVADWLLERVLGGFELPALVQDACPRLVAAGLPLARVNVSFSILHPLFRAQSMTWWREQTSLEHDRLPHGPDTAAWLRSPYAYMLESDLTVLRLPIGDEQAVDRFPLIAELRQAGITDYLARVVFFGDARRKGMIMSFATDHPDGFTSAHLVSLERVVVAMGLAGKVYVESQVAQNLAVTYLGQDAGSRVLRGRIRRGDNEIIPAAVLYSDMRDSTRLADTLPRADFLGLLGDYFECTAGAVLDQGGEVLALIGDAVLAIFPTAAGGVPAACARACDAARSALARRDQTNAVRASAGKPMIDFGIGLHLGDVAYGNIGVPERLCFTAIGPTTNEVARLESLTKALGQTVLASDPFAREVGVAWHHLGLYELRGARVPRAVFALPAE